MLFFIQIFSPFLDILVVILTIVLQYCQQTIQISLLNLNFLNLTKAKLQIRQLQLEAQHIYHSLDGRIYRISLHEVINTFIGVECDYSSYSYIFLES